MRMNRCCCFYFVILLICCSHLHFKNRRTIVSVVCSKSIDVVNEDVLNGSNPSSENNEDQQPPAASKDSQSESKINSSVDSPSGVSPDGSAADSPYDPLFPFPDSTGDVSSDSSADFVSSVSVEPSSERPSDSSSTDLLDSSSSEITSVLHIFLKCLDSTSKSLNGREMLREKLLSVKSCYDKSVSEKNMKKIFDDFMTIMEKYMGNDMEKEPIISNEKTVNLKAKSVNIEHEIKDLFDLMVDVYNSLVETPYVVSNVSNVSYSVEVDAEDRTLTDDEEEEEEEEEMHKHVSSLWQKGFSWSSLFGGDDSEEDNNYSRNTYPSPTANVQHGRDMSQPYGCQSESDKQVIYEQNSTNSRQSSELRPRNNFFAFLLECSRSNIGSGPATINCLKEKLQRQQATVSDRCLECFKSSVECGRSNCWFSCIFASPCSETCFNCGVRYCQQKLKECTGLPDLPAACT